MLYDYFNKLLANRSHTLDIVPCMSSSALNFTLYRFLNMIYLNTDLPLNHIFPKRQFFYHEKQKN